jgi:predicted TIM-barrel fold metal-dependent hydrolase
MIVDCHAHVIENWIGTGGHPTRSIHAKYMQRMLAFTVAKTFHARTGKPADTKALLDPNDRGWTGLRDVDFRVGRFGQMEFTVDGEDYYVQYMPVNMQNIESPPDFMLAQMTYIGVDHTVLQAGGAYGAMTSYNAFAQSQYPQKFTGLIHVDEAMGGTPECLAEIERGARLGLKGIYYNVDGFSRHGFPWLMDDSRLDPMWDLIQKRGLILCAEISSGPSYDAKGYASHILALGRVLKRYPRIKCHLAMGIPAQFFSKGDHWEIPAEIEEVYKRDNFLIEIMFPITWGGRWDYPYKEAQPLIRDLRDRFGAEKLIWGSDMPNVERFCTYQQSLDYVVRYCDFLTSGDMELILGINCVRLYNIPSKEAGHA